MRIALVSEHASPLAVLGEVDAGGQNVHVAALATSLAAIGHEVMVHTRRDCTDLPATTAMGPGVTVDHVRAGPPRAVPKDDLVEHMPLFGAELARRWEVSPPDVVHAHFWMSGMAAMPVAQRLGIPFVQTFHALGTVKRRYHGTADTSPAVRIDTEAAIARGADALVATCSDEVFELVRTGAHRSRITVVPSGVDLRHFTPGGPASARHGCAHRLLSVGRLVERKGVAEVISALGEVPDTELLVAGGPDRSALAGDPEATRLRRLADTSGVGERVRFLGRVGREELPSLMRSSDAVVCFPWYEPFGLVPLEAMACGVPVVAASVGGLIDTVVDDVTGLRVPPGDRSALGASLRRLLGDTELRHRLGQGGVQRARSRFGWARVARATAEIYAELVATPTRSEARR